MKLYNYIYKITNLVNGKIYIGKHSTDNLDDGYMGSGVRLHRAYKKYGLECFNKEVILFYTSEEELNQGEIFWIAKFNSTDLNIGYNLTFGGDGGMPTTETRRKIGEAKKGIIPWNKGVPMSEEQKQKLSIVNKGKPLSEEHRRKMCEAKKGKNNPMYGKPLSEEHRQKLRLAWQRRKLAKLNQQNNG